MEIRCIGGKREKNGRPGKGLCIGEGDFQGNENQRVEAVPATGRRDCRQMYLRRYLCFPKQMCKTSDWWCPDAIRGRSENEKNDVM